MKKKIFIAAAVLFSSQLQAQTPVPVISRDSTKGLNEVVITATKFPIKQSLTGKVVTVIDLQQLQRNRGKSLSEVLNNQTGIIVNGSSNVLGTNQDVYVRGAAAGKTLVMLDGVPVYDASGISGAFDLNLISVDQVERIEILKGSQSTLYGSDAIAAVINIISKKGGAKKINATANLAGGSYGTFKGSVGLNGTVKNTNYNLQYSKLYSKGFSTAQDQSGTGNFDKDGMDENVFRANLSQKITGKFSVRANTSFSNYKTDADAAPFKDDADYTIKNKNSVIGFGADYSIGKSILHFNYNYNRINRFYLDDSASRGDFFYYSKGDYTGKSHFAELYSNIAVTKHIDVLVGADYRNHLAGQAYTAISMLGPYDAPALIDDSVKVTQFGAYTSVVVKDMAGFNLELGGRYNNFNKYGNVFTFSFNPSYVIKNSIKIFGNISSGFKAPSLYQVFSEYRPLAELKPERSFSFESGIQYYKNKVNLRAVYFIRNIKDNIVFVNTNNPPYGYYTNADEQKDKGLELEAGIDFGKVTLNANYVNLDGKIETRTGNSDTAFFNLYRRPKQTINLNVGIELCKNWNMNIAVQSISKRYEIITYGTAPGEMPAYYVWNLFSTYSFTKHIQAFVDLKNITDEKYAEVYGYNSRRFNFMAGVSLNF